MSTFHALSGNCECGSTLRVKSRSLEKIVKCPTCGRDVAAKSAVAPTPMAPAPQPVRKPSRPSRGEVVARPPRTEPPPMPVPEAVVARPPYAESTANLPVVGPDEDVYDAFDGSVRSADGTARVVELLAEEFPAVEQAYVPSGIIPPAGYAYVFVGSLVGLVAYLVLRVVLSFLAMLVVGIIFGLAAAAEVGLFTVIMIIVGGVVALAAFVAVYAVAGIGMAGCVSYFAGLGHCRNATVPALASVATIVLGQIVMLLVAMAWTETAVEDKDGTSMPFAFLLFECGIGGIIAAVAAALFTIQETGANAYCEPCLRFMNKSGFVVGPQSFVALVEAVKANDGPGISAATANLLAGTAGRLDIARCPKCQHCYLNVRLVHTLLTQGEKGIEKTEIDRIVATLSTNAGVLKCEIV